MSKVVRLTEEELELDNTGDTGIDFLTIFKEIVK